MEEKRIQAEISQQMGVKVVEDLEDFHLLI